MYTHQNVFNPTNVMANVGDTIHFQLYVFTNATSRPHC